MNLFKIIAFAAAGGLISLIVREYNKSFGMLTAMAVGAGIMLMSCDMLAAVLSRMREIENISGLDGEYIAVVVKVIGVAYITQFGAEALRDSGENAIALKTEFAGKTVILYIIMPIAADFLKICMEAARRL